MIPQILAIFLHLVAIRNCFKALADDPDHKIEAEVAMILTSSMLFCLVCIYTLISYRSGVFDSHSNVATLWQVYSVYNALTYAITTKRLTECSTTQRSSTK